MLTLLLAFTCSHLRTTCTTRQGDLLTAADAGNILQLADALAGGAEVDARNDRGETALMLAAAAAAFAPCRELLWAGADANATDHAGQTALDHIAAPSDENLPLRIMLCAYAYLQTSAARSAIKPAYPALVMIMEDTVNYMHPKIKEAYEQNFLEALGDEKVDDDKNGFVDDVYGWIPVFNQPYTIRETQFQAYLKYRESITRIIQIDNDHARGKITDYEAGKRLREYTNPLAEIMGPVSGLSDGEFLEMLKLAAHGSHVAGIVLDASEGKARLHTLGMNFAETTQRMLGAETDRILDQLHAESFEPEVMLEALRVKLLEACTQRGRTSSRYLKATGAGIANLSFGGGMPYWHSVARTHIKRCIEDQRSMDPSAELDEDSNDLAKRWALQLYVANAAELGIVFFENPDVLFVVAAGNEDQDNDEHFTTPAYMSRFFPNVITVASVGDENRISSFSNYGLTSVNLGAPGENILSTAIPEASVHMNGTSMAAPFVAGVAALIRSLSPETSASDIRRLLDYTVLDIEDMHRFVTSGGVIDKEALRGVFTGSARTKANSQARVAFNAVALSDDLYPRHAADAKTAAALAIQLDDTSPAAWRALSLVRAAEGEFGAALQAIEQALKLDPKSEPAWMERAAVQSALGNNAGLFESIGKAIDVLAAQGKAADHQRARHLALRAELFLQLGETVNAKRDAAMAKALNPGMELSPELLALL